MLLTYTTAILATLAAVLTAWQFWLAMRTALDAPAPEGSPVASTPPVSVLKPLKGCDTNTAECLRSWITQAYAGDLQILFGVASADDPVCSVVRSLLAAHPKADAQLVLCPERLGPNAKISTVIQLERLARHEILVVSDADVFVPFQFLSQLVRPLQHGNVGVVSCLYRQENASNVAMRLEAFAVNADFWSQVLQARSLKPMDFALGAVMATTRSHMNRIGGFTALVDYLADDFQLGNRMASAGATVELLPVVVECRGDSMSWSEVWAHQLRWARTIRVCRPGPFFLSILSNVTLWATLLWISHPTGHVFLGTGGLLVLRMVTAFAMERKFTGRADASSLWVAPLKDVLAVAIWALAFLGNSVVWRGGRYDVQRGGKLVKPG